MIDWGSLAALMSELIDRPVFAIDGEGRVTLFNSAMERLSEFRRHEVLGQRLAEHCAPVLLRPAVEATLDSAARDGLHRAELQCLTKSGARLSVDVDVWPLHASANENTGVACVVTSMRRDPLRLLAPAISDCEYEVSIAEADFGTILRDLSPGATDTEVGRRCFEILDNGVERCGHCPLAVPTELGAPLSFTVPLRSGGVTLVRAVRTSATTAQVGHQVVAREGFAELLKGRLAGVAEQCGLSAREREVLDLLVLGRSMEEIGVVLAISARTVKFHQANLLGKLGLESRLDLLRLLL